MTMCKLYQNHQELRAECVYKNDYARKHINSDRKTYVNYECKNCKNCHIKQNLQYRTYKLANLIMNDFQNGKKEMIYYKKPFNVIDDHANIEGKKVERNWKTFNDPEFGKILVPKNNRIHSCHLYDSLIKAGKRAQDKYYGFAQSNTWGYFATFTVSPEVCDRFNDKSVKELWHLFQKRLYLLDKNIKYICVPERHENGALHFHALIDTNVDLNLKLYKEKGKYKYTKFGTPLFALDLWKYGIATVAVLDKADNQNAVINYLVAYTSKQCNLGYGNKRYYMSRNLICKDKLIVYVPVNEVESTLPINSAEFSAYKDTEKFVVYRNFNVKEPLNQDYINLKLENNLSTFSTRNIAKSNTNSADNQLEIEREYFEKRRIKKYREIKFNFIEIAIVEKPPFDTNSAMQVSMYDLPY